MASISTPTASLSSDDVGPSLVPDITPDLFCDPCVDDGNQLQAEGYCVDCAQYLCGICFLYHCRPKPSRHHQLLDKQLMPKVPSDRVYRDECTDRCPVHGDEILEFFCEDHHQVGCTICVRLGHTTCNVGYIPTLSGDIFESQEYNTCKRDIDSMAYRIKSLLEAAARNLEYVGLHTERTLHTVRKLRKQIDSVFDDLEQEIIGRVVKTHVEDQKRIDAISDQCEKQAKTINVLKADIEDKERKKQKCRLFVDTKHLQDALDRYKNDIGQMEKSNPVGLLTFKPSERILGLISERSTELFGHLGDFCESLSVNQASDVDCSIIDIAVLSGGRIAAIDVHNVCIKVIDTKRDRMVTSMGLPNDTRYLISIAAISDDEIVVSYYNKLEICVVKDEIKKRKTMLTALYGRGLVFTNNQYIGVPSWNQSSLCMVNMNGGVVKTFPSQKDGERLFKYPWYITVNPDQSSIYVSDWGKETVTCLTSDGKVKSRYKYSSEWSPRGIAVSRDGHVYVCDSKNNAIHILTCDLEEVGHITGEEYNLCEPQGLAYCEKERKLFVGLRCRTTVRVFNI